MDELEKVSTAVKAWNGKPLRSSRAEVIKALAPIFAAFPNSKLTQDEFNDMLNVYVKMLEDIEPQVLQRAVMAVLTSCKFLPTIAEIREQIETRAPGPRSEGSAMPHGPVPQKFFRLSDDEDKRQRMMQLKRTERWSKYYA